MYIIGVTCAPAGANPIAPTSSVKAGDDLQESGGTSTPLADDSRFPSDRVDMSGEIEGVLYFNVRLRGTGTGAHEVWPGVWRFEKNHCVGDARLDYVPRAFDFLVPRQPFYLLWEHLGTFGSSVGSG